MSETDWKHLLDEFLQDVKRTNNPSFVDVESWTMADDLLNGVLIGYTIKERSDRELLHRTGLKYGLIPLCPGEVVDIDVSDDNTIAGSFVRTRFGKMQIRPKPG